MRNDAILIERARQYEAAVYAEAIRMTPSLVGTIVDPYQEALRVAAHRLVPKEWLWRIEPTYGGSAVFFITHYAGT